ncbi:MAG: hypothetical protein ABSA80_14410 [Terriglobales bacterium]|jgi:hypothetical protein
MKHIKRVAMATLLLLGTVGLSISGAAAQSLGEYARTVRKNKPEPSPATRHFDNDNIPTSENVSVVGPPATGDASGQATKAAAVDAAAAAAADRKSAADEWKKKLDNQKEKIDAMNHELDLQQREYRLRASAYYGDVGTRLRDAAQFDKDDAQYKSDVEQKQKAIAAARQELDEMQEQAHKAGMVEKDKDSDKDNTNDKK